MTGQAIVDLLEGVRSCGTGRYMARCPAHADKSPSLSIREDNTRILIRCFSGCSVQEIVAALGLQLKDLFTDAPTSRGQWPTPKPQKLDLVDVANRFDLAALDRRLRANAVFQAVGDFDGDLSDQQRDQLMSVVAGAYADEERAEFLEAMADSFRLKEWDARRRDHAA